MPWPKHPCTDTPFHRNFGQVKFLRTVGVRAGGGYLQAIEQERGMPRHEWRPLLFTASGEVDGGVNRVRLRDTSVPGFLYLPRLYLQQPAAWRWSPTTPGVVELSTFRITADGGLLPEQLAQSGCLLDDSDWRRHEQGDHERTRRQLVALGMAAAGGVGVGAHANRDYVLAHHLLQRALFMGEVEVDVLLVLDNVTKTLLGANDQSGFGELRACLELRRLRNP